MFAPKMSADKSLAFDTSNYTTSAATLTVSGEVCNLKKLLPVESGKRGLRQSDAVFAHTRQLYDVFQSLDPSGIEAVGVSTRPRSVEGSYMPCFLVGKNVGHIVAKTLGVPVYEFSHQQGHIAAGIFSCGKKELLNGGFYAFHLSGGTMELAEVESMDRIRIVAETDDLTAGQLIDRCGVRLGLGFPAGAELEKLAREGTLPRKPKVVFKNGKCSLSGFENIAEKMISDSVSPCDTAAFVFESVYKNIETMTDYAVREYGEKPVLFVGGVMSNALMRPRLEARYESYFAEPSLSSDNAVGTAYLTLAAANGQIDIFKPATE